MARQDQAAKQFDSAVEMLAADHRTVRELFQQYEAAGSLAAKQLVEEAREEHQEVKTLIADLRNLDDDDAFDVQFRELMDNVEHHVQEEETEMFPLAEEMGESRSSFQPRKHTLGCL